MKFRVVGFFEPDGSDAVQIASFNWRVVPRVGETLRLTGPQFGNAHSTRHGVDGESYFTVTDVTYTDIVTAEGHGEDGTELDIAVIVERHEVEREPMRLRCACKDSLGIFNYLGKPVCPTCGGTFSLAGRP
jgi:hypothetical protein